MVLPSAVRVSAIRGEKGKNATERDIRRRKERIREKRGEEGRRKKRDRKEKEGNGNGRMR